MSEIGTLMKTFVTVADMGSFSAAAARLDISQSAVSKQIVALERHLGTRLFHRSTRSLALTDEGIAYYDGALVALAAIDDAEAAIGRDAEIRGLIRLTLPLTLAESRVIPIIARFLEAHPRIQVDLTLSDHALNLVADNINLAVRVGWLGDSRLIARKIGTARRILVASPAYLSRAGRPTVPADLETHNCLSYSLLTTGARWKFVSGETATIHGNFRTDSPNALRAGALAGMGIAVNARWLFEREIECGELEVLLPEFEPEPMPIHAVLPSGQYVPARVRLFVEFLAKEFARDRLLSLSDQIQREGQAAK